ncbi:ISLre2 family transposase [Marinilactibacillus piezotolerans]|uniref:ISLre2 family transposase n=1 Tax=Marinilactibacillus piezotolerans TaxID=258723 RepID=UPI0009B0C885|nr:ISLre2 family transposase [Marinilactibacillus piezotolerans]
MKIIAQMMEILEGSATFLEAEILFEELFRQKAEECFQECIERLDKKCIQSYKDQGYEIDSVRKRTMQFTFGTVEFSRRRVRKKGEKSLIPLDKFLQLSSRSRNSPLVEMKAAQMASDGVYRKAADAINLLTNFSLSHSAIHSITQRVGQKVQEWTEQKPLSDETMMKEKRKAPVLFIEGDGLLLTRRKGKERAELHRVQIHEGVEKKGKRPVLVNSMMFESTESSQEAFKRASAWIEATYDLRNTVIISNSDGGSGYEKDKFDSIIGKCARHEHFRDAYHVNQKIKQRLSFDKELSYQMISAVRKWDYARICAVISQANDRIQDDYRRTEYELELTKLLSYLDRNWDSLKGLHLRYLPLRKGIGVCESNHRPYSYRMKRQGRGFGQKGAGNLAAIISARKNGLFLQALTETIPAFKQEFIPEFKGILRTLLKKSKTRNSIGVIEGRIGKRCASSHALGQLAKVLK